MVRKKQLTNGVKRSLITDTDPKSPISEQFRTLRTNIQFSSLDQKLQTIVVTSSSPAEGKSTVAANLAVVLSQQDHRVLLVDTDLRKPTIHYTFRTQNKYGLSTIITGQGNFEDIINESSVAGVDVLPSGPIPPNPSEMLSSKRMKQFIAEVKNEYDYVIFDTPPVNAVTDPQIMAGLVDGVVLTVRSGKTDRAEARYSVDLLKKVEAKILGVVLNDVAMEKGNYYYYYGT